MNTDIIIANPDHEIQINEGFLSKPEWQGVANNWLINLNRMQTRITYSSILQDFANFVGKSADLVTSDDVFKFKLALEKYRTKAGKPYSAATINLKLSAVGSFYSFAKAQGKIEDNPVSGVDRKPVKPYGKATKLNGDDDKTFLKQINKSTLQGKRDYAIMLLFLTTGVRVDAIANATIGSLKRVGSELRFEFVNKGGTIENVPVTNKTLAAIEDYLSERGIDRFTCHSDTPLFVATPKGLKVSKHVKGNGEIQPLSARMIQKLVKKYADKAFGKNSNIHPHSLRHTVASNASENEPINTVSKLLKHKNVRVTGIYLDHMVDDKQIKSAVDTLDERY